MYSHPDLFGSLTTLDRSRPSAFASRTPRAARIVARLLGIILVASILALVFVPWQQSVQGHGRVIAYAPLERQQTVQAAIEGRVEHWYVQEGDRVEAGDRLAELTDNDPEIIARLEREREAAIAHRAAAEGAVAVASARITSLEMARDAKRSSAALRVEMARSRLSAGRRAVDAGDAALRTAKLNLARQQQLFDEGLTSKRQLELAQMEYETREAELDRARDNLEAAEREVAALAADREHAGADASADVEGARAALRKAEADLAKAEAEVQQVDVRLARQQRMTIVAPRAGTILRLLAREGSEMLKPGDPVVIFVPDITANAVELWVDGKDAPLITAGREVRLQFEGWPAVQFVGWPSAAVGTFGGVVEFVDASADERGRFRVVVSPDPEDEPWPDNRWLRQGVRVNGWVLLDQVSLGFELWRQFNGFPPAVGDAAGAGKDK
jgi:adhesin transport system membrane fusion protein